MKQECHYFHKSVCKRGSQCNFKHTEPKLGKCPNTKCKICQNQKEIEGRSKKGSEYVKTETVLKKQVKKEEKPEKVKRPVRPEISETIIQKKQEEAYVPSEQIQEQNILKVQKKEDSVFQNISDHKNQIFEIRIRQAYQDLQIFKPLEKIFQSKLSLDLMFILDCTGSMSSWIKACKNELNNIIDQVLYEHEGATINISVVAYRDIQDTKRFEVMPFTTDKDIVQKFIAGLLAMGGGDTPQDICGAFKQALAQNWKSTAKYAVLITDAPCHGKKYHTSDDSYPNGDPHNLNPQHQIQQFVQKGINLYGIKITNLTDKMYQIFSEVYQEASKTPMCVGNLGQNTKSFGFYIASTVTATLSASVVNSDVSYIKRALKQLKVNYKDKKLTAQKQLQILMKIQETPANQSQKIQIQESAHLIYYDKKFKGIPVWNDLQDSELYDCIEHTYFIVKDKGVAINWRKPLVQNSQITSKVKICKLPFSEGGMRYAFYAYDTVLQQKLVTKRNKKQKLNNIKEMSKDLELVYICQHIVNTFNDTIVQLVPDTRLLLTFVHTFLIELKNENKFFYAENYIDGDYQKFNNNAGWQNNKVSQSSLISQAFSHYSYQFTQGYLMVVDIQGSSGILTDPQIHCLDYQRFGAGNLGYQGILKFFFNHRCNHYCGSLGLIHPKNQSKLPENFKFYNQEIKKPADPKKKVFTICDLCKGAYSSTAGFVYTKRVEDQLKYCKPCDDKRKNSMRKGKCEWCQTSFSSSEYWFKMMRTDFPTLCGDCRKKRREMWRQQLEKKDEKQKEQIIEIVKEQIKKNPQTSVTKQQVLPQKKLQSKIQNLIIEQQKTKDPQPEIWQTYKFDINLFQNSDEFKLWMSELGLVYTTDYRFLMKVKNQNQTYGKLEMLVKKLSIANGKAFKGTPVTFVKK